MIALAGPRAAGLALAAIDGVPTSAAAAGRLSPSVAVDDTYPPASARDCHKSNSGTYISDSLCRRVNRRSNAQATRTPQLAMARIT